VSRCVLDPPRRTYVYALGSPKGEDKSKPLCDNSFGKVTFLPVALQRVKVCSWSAATEICLRFGFAEKGKGIEAASRQQFWKSNVVACGIATCQSVFLIRRDENMSTLWVRRQGEINRSRFATTVLEKWRVCPPRELSLSRNPNFTNCGAKQASVRQQRDNVIKWNPPINVWSEFCFCVFFFVSRALLKYTP